MNWLLLIANVLTIIAFMAHTLRGDAEIRMIAPIDKDIKQINQRQIWTMARCSCHWISVDFLFAAIGLSIINFTSILANPSQLLKILSLYFVIYGTTWLVTIMISKQFRRNYILLGQWLLLWIIGGLIYLRTI